MPDERVPYVHQHHICFEPPHCLLAIIHQLAGRPAPDLCRQLGLTVTATTVSPISNSGLIERRNSHKLESNCRHGQSRGRKSREQRIEQIEPLITPARSIPAVAGAAAAWPIDEGMSGAKAQPTSRLPREKRGHMQPVVLLPRQRIFYSNTFVRLVLRSCKARDDGVASMTSNECDAMV